MLFDDFLRTDSSWAGEKEAGRCTLGGRVGAGSLAGVSKVLGWEREARRLCTDLRKPRGGSHSTRPRRGLPSGPLGE